MQALMELSPEQREAIIENHDVVAQTSVGVDQDVSAFVPMIIENTDLLLHVVQRNPEGGYRNGHVYEVNPAIWDRAMEDGGMHFIESAIYQDLRRFGPIESIIFTQEKPVA